MVAKKKAIYLYRNLAFYLNEELAHKKYNK